MNVKPHLFGLALTILLVIAVACGGDGSQEPADTPTTEPTATMIPVSATSTPPRTEGATGIPELDVVIDALRSGDRDALRPLIGFRKVACRPGGLMFTGAPDCMPDEEDGELVDVFSFVACEGEYFRPQANDRIDQIVSALAESELYAVYRAADDERYPAEYVAVVSDTAGLAWAILIEDGLIFRLSFSCAVPTHEFAERFDNPVFPPAGFTGIHELDKLIDALRTGDPDAIRPYLVFTEVACSTRTQASVTMCAADEEEGEFVEVFQFSLCEGQGLRPEEIDRALSVLIEAELYAVYRAADDERYPAEYVAVVSDTAGLAWAILIEDGLIFRLSFSCAVPTEEFAARFQDAVLPPQPR